MSRNAVPVAGLAFFGWSAIPLIILYFIDFLVDIALVLALMMLLDPSFRTTMEIPPGRAGYGKMAGAMAFVIAVLVAVFGFVFGMPVFGMLTMDTDASLGALFSDSRFLRALAVHFALSSWTYIQAYRYFARWVAADATFDVSLRLRGRFRYVLGRWLAVYAAGLFVPFFPALMVVAFCVATVYIEMFPKRLQAFFADDAKPGSPLP